MRLATFVSQPPGDPMASCCAAGHGVPAGVRLLDDVLGIGQGAEQPVREIDQLTPLAHDRGQARLGLPVSRLGSDAMDMVPRLPLVAWPVTGPTRQRARL